MLDEDSEKPLHRTQQRPVNHVGAPLLTLFVNVLQLKELRQVEVKLDCAELPFPTQGVLDLDVDLGAVECRFSLIDAIGDAGPVECLAQGLGRSLPELGRACRLGRVPGGEVGLEVPEAEGPQDIQAELQDAVDLIRHLVRPAEQVGVVLGEAADAHQAVQHPTALEAVYGPPLRKAQRQVAIGARLALVDLDVKGTVHRLEVILLTLDIERGVHVLPVPIQVPACLPQASLADVGRVDELVAALLVFEAAVVLGDLADHASLGVPQDQPGADILAHAEEAQLATQAAMIALLGLLQLPQVPLKLLGLLPGCAVDPLQHGALLIAAPVGPSDAHELDGGRVELTRSLHMRAAAQVRERAVRVERKLPSLVKRLTVLIEPALLQAADEFLLVGLVSEDPARLFGRDHLPLKRKVGRDDLAHPLLDLLQVLRRQCAGQVEVVVETILDRWADGDLGLPGEQLHHRLRHHVRRRMPDPVQLRLLVRFF